MSQVTATLTLRNPKLPHIATDVHVLVDSASPLLCIPERVRALLELEAIDIRHVALTDGSIQVVPYVGPVEMSYKGRAAFGGAVVMGNQVLLGQMPMGEMNLVIASKTQTLEVSMESVRA